MSGRKARAEYRIPRALSVLLATCILLCAKAAGAAAAEALSSWPLLQEAIDQAETGKIIALTEDVIATPEDTRLIVPSGKWITLDLNGYSLDRNLNGQKVYDGCVLYVQAGAMLTLRDSGDAEGKVTGGYHDNGGGILNHGTMIMEGGCVTGNTAKHAGGGIANYGSMILLSGQVKGNTALEAGGGIYNQAKAHLTIHGGLVEENSAPKDGEIANEGALTIVSAREDQAVREDMPLLHLFLFELSVLPAVALLLAVREDTHLSKERRGMMIAILATVFALILQNYLEYRVSLRPGANALRLPLAVLGYVLRPAILAMFLSIVRPGRRYWPAWALVGMNACVYLTAFFSGIAFSFNENGHFISGPLRHTCTVVSALLFAWLFILTIREFLPQPGRKSWIPVFVTVLIAGGVFMDFTAAFDEQPVSFLDMSIVISCVFYYIWLHLQFVREHEDSLRAGLPGAEPASEAAEKEEAEPEETELQDAA